jgi:hypothetical protein
VSLEDWLGRNPVPISAPGRFRRIEAKRALRVNLNNRKSHVPSGALAINLLNGVGGIIDIGGGKVGRFIYGTQIETGI